MKVIMKRYMVVIFLLFALSAVTMPMVFAAMTKPMITVRLEKYDPVPVEPGSVFDVWAGIDNKGEALSTMRMRLVNAFPFTSLQEKVDVGTVPASEKVLVHFLVKTDVAAQSKDYNLTFEYQWGDNDKWWVQSTAPVQLRTSGASVSVSSYQITPSEIMPGSTANLVLVIENTGRTTVKDIDISLDLHEKFSLSGTGTTRRLTSLKPGEKEELPYTLIADPSAEPKVYSFPVALSYSDDRNNKYIRSSSISASVNAKPDVLVMVNDVVKQKNNVKVSLKTINKGTVNLKSLTLHLLPGEYNLASGDTRYLGNVDSDDFEIVDFTIALKGKQASVPYEVMFKDPYNKDFTIRGSALVTMPEEEAQRGTYWLPLLSGMLGIIIGFFIGRRRKK